jgi:NAD(P)-dependent dehydrogenase (short-subunit alcohol dehydrogenase family)/acyl carrier protein
LDDVQARRQQKIKYKWIVFSDNQYRSNQLVEQLKKEGHYVISVLKGNSFSKLSEDLYTVCPYKKLDYELLFTELEQKRLLPDKIIHAWSLNPVQESNLGIERVEHAIQQGYYSLLYISQSIAKCSYEGSLQIVVLTERMYDVTGTEKSLRPELAPILGFTKICNLEFTNMNCRIIDFDLDSDYSYVDAVLTECFSSANDMIVAYRGRHRWLQTMIQRRFEKVDMMKNKLREGGVYLITGGLGGIGLSIAKYLAKKVPGIKLVLLGRSEFPPRDQWDEHLTHEDERKAHVISSLLEMENYGSENMIISSDVANEAEMSKVIRDVKARFGTINGVIHAAGIADYLGVMVNRKKEANDEILAPKIKGTLVLDSLLKDEPLDFFVLCSSIGNVAYHMKFGQSGYNAANEFLDAFANYKNSLGGVYTVSINWPDWQEVGMSLESAEIWARQFNLDLNTVLNEGMSVEEGLEVFQRVVNSNHQQVIASPTDLHWKLTHEASYYNQLLERGSENRIKQDRSNLMATYSPPTNEIEQKLSELWKNMFGLEQIGIYDNFFDLGISSLDLVRVNAKLKELFNRDVPIIALYEHTSIHALSEYLSDTETNYNSTASKTKLKKSKSVMKDTLSALNRRK